jgi:UDP-N-acetylglucosamine:LPS N-acetylglucosamine transferase
LLAALSGLLKHRQELSEMSERARTFAHPQAAAKIAEMVAVLASSSH